MVNTQGRNLLVPCSHRSRGSVLRSRNHLNVSSLLIESTHPLSEVQRPLQTQRLHTLLDNAVHQGRAALEAGGCKVEAGRFGTLAVVGVVSLNSIG